MTSHDETNTHRWRWIFIGLGALGVAFIIFFGAGRIAAARDQAQPAREETLPLVETVEVEAEPNRFFVTEEAFLRPRAEVEVVPEVAGRVVEVAPQLEPGGRFEKGELMFRIDPRTFEAELARAEADLEAAESELERARAEEARQTRLAEIGAAAESRLQQASASAASARARVGQAEAALISARKRVEDTSVSAPFAASVIEESVALGRYVQPGVSAATIFDTGAAEIVVGLLPTEANAVRLAAEAQEEPLDVVVKPTSASATTATLAGRVKRFGSSVDRQSRTVPVVIEVLNAFDEGHEATVFANDFVTVEIPARSPQQLFSAPNGVVREERYVWTLDQENRLRKIDVTPVQRTQTEVTFRSEGDLTGRTIVLTALTEEAEGMKVEVADSRARRETLQ